MAALMLPGLPYAAASERAASGVTRYAVAVGQYLQPSWLKSRPMMAQATIQHGFSNLVTGYGGAVMAQGYFAAQGGVALNTAFGAIGAGCHAVFCPLSQCARS